MDELLQVVDEATPHIEAAASRYARLERYDPSLLLRFSICELASELLRSYLQHRHGIQTVPEMAVLDEIPTERGIGMRHVLLREPTSDTRIDPTYSQFLSVLGLSRQMLEGYPELSRYFPPEKIALIRVDDDMFGWRFAESAHIQAPRVQRALARRGITLAQGIPRTSERLHTVYDRIWHATRYHPLQQGSSYHPQLLEQLLDGEL